MHAYTSMRAGGQREIVHPIDTHSHQQAEVFLRQLLREKFTPDHNRNWIKHTRPIVEAFFHPHFMLKMVCKYGRELSEPPQMLPSGWAAVLYLFNLR